MTLSPPEALPTTDFGLGKVQDLRSRKHPVGLRIPDARQKLRSYRSGAGTVQAGTITHKLKVAGNDAWELYDYPGGYGKRLIGVSKSGGDQSSNLQQIFTDNARTVKLRMGRRRPGFEHPRAEFAPGFYFGIQLPVTRPLFRRWRIYAGGGGARRAPAAGQRPTVSIRQYIPRDSRRPAVRAGAHHPRNPSCRAPRRRWLERRGMKSRPSINTTALRCNSPGTDKARTT